MQTRKVDEPVFGTGEYQLYRTKVPFKLKLLRWLSGKFRWLKT